MKWSELYKQQHQSKQIFACDHVLCVRNQMHQWENLHCFVYIEFCCRRWNCSDTVHNTPFPLLMHPCISVNCKGFIVPLNALFFSCPIAVMKKKSGVASLSAHFHQHQTSAQHSSLFCSANNVLLLCQYKTYLSFILSSNSNLVKISLENRALIHFIHILRHIRVL